MYITKKKVGGMTFVRFHWFGRTFVVSYCETRKHHVVAV